MNKEDYLKELQNELNNTDEFFLISKNKENYKLIHSNLTDCMEWLRHDRNIQGKVRRQDN